MGVFVCVCMCSWSAPHACILYRLWTKYILVYCSIVVILDSLLSAVCLSMWIKLSPSPPPPIRLAVYVLCMCGYVCVCTLVCELENANILLCSAVCLFFFCCFFSVVFYTSILIYIDPDLTNLLFILYHI